MWELLEYGPFLVFSNCVEFCRTHSIYHYFQSVEESPNNGCGKNFWNHLIFAHKLF